MELRHLRYFVAVAEELHFGRAAARLAISQPPLSQQIRRLERELQATLLYRTKRQVELTTAGRVFLGAAKEIVAHAERAAVLAQRAGRGEAGQLRVGSALWADFTIGSTIIRIFSERRPGVEVELRDLSVPEQIAALEAGHLDLGILRPPVRSKALNTERLLSERLVVVFPQRHRFKDYDRVPWIALSDQPYIRFSARRAPAFDAVVARGCHDAGVTLNVKYEVEHPHTVLSIVEAGLGISCVPASLTRMRRPGIAYRPLRPAGPPLETLIAWRRGRDVPLIQMFVRVAKEAAAATL